MAFRKENPGIAIHLRDAVGIKVANMVRAGEVDFGFGSLPASGPDVEFTPLFNDRLSAIFPRHSPLGQKRSLSLKDLAASPLILMGRDSSVRAVVDRALAAIGHLDPPAYEASYISTALGMVEAGLGVTILPASVLRMDRGHGLIEPTDSESQDRPRGRPDSVEGQVSFARRRRIPAGATGAVRGAVCPPKVSQIYLSPL